MRALRLLLVATFAALAAGGCGGGGGTSTAPATPPRVLQSATPNAAAPKLFRVAFKTTKGTFVVTVHRAWAPRGARRFYNLVKARFYDGVTFFRVVPSFVVQFGISGRPAVSRQWAHAVIPDDPRRESNTRGTITFATAGPNTRTTQVFVNLADNRSLDPQGFTPFGRVTSGMAVIGKLYSGYGDQPTSFQPQMERQGNAFLKKRFPKLDHIVTARVTG